ncbi:MAG: CPBP family glutamic-type intramembrane protease [Terracidiphilus sp.]|jgi:hypothetical protein
MSRDMLFEGRAASEVAAQANLPQAINERVAAKRITWAGPLLMVTARSVLLIAFQALVALILLERGKATPWRAAGDWWGVYGTLVDIGCLLGLKYFTRREGIKLRDLLGPVRMSRGHDVWLGLGYFLLIFPFFLGGSYATRLLLYGSADQSLNRYLLHMHALPVWATVYGLTLWWMIWSPTEEATYNGYVLPRMQALTGRKWVPWMFVGFWWALQHSALPFVPDWKYLTFRFLGFLPGVLVMMLFYMRTRRLAPLIVAHWPMDIAAAVMTAIY